MHYCCICGGPATSLDLRRASLANDGDDIERCHDDMCDCIGEDCDDDSCPSQFGYNSNVLLEGDTKWLDSVRLICPSMNKDGTGPATDSQFAVYITNIGVYDGYEGLVRFPNTGLPNLCPNKEGFLVHDCCLSILFFVQSNSSKEYPQLIPEHLFLAMQAYALTSPEKTIHWNDSRLYGGGVHGFQSPDRWEALYGFEWLVTNPTKYTDLPYLLNYAAHPEIVAMRSPIWGSLKPEKKKKENPTTTGDYFRKLPAELQHKILQLLPTNAVHNLSIASFVFYNATRYLPNSFWKSRLGQGRYSYLAPFYETLTWVRGPINYYHLLALLEDVSRPWPHGDKVLPSKEEPMCPFWNSFKNWRRIWGCCEAVLDKVGAYENAIATAAA